MVLEEEEENRDREGRRMPVMVDRCLVDDDSVLFKGELWAEATVYSDLSARSVLGSCFEPLYTYTLFNVLSRLSF